MAKPTISWSQYWFFAKKVLSYNPERDKIEGIWHDYRPELLGFKYINKENGVTIAMRRFSSDDKLIIQVRNSKQVLERKIETIAFPLFKVFDRHLLLYHFLRKFIHRKLKAEKDISDREIEAVSMFIDAAYPEEIEKQLLGD